VAVTLNGAVLTANVALGTTPQNLTWTSPPLTAGDVVVLVVDMNAASANFPASATPTGGTGLSWTSVVSETNTAGHESAVRVWWTNVPTTHTPASIVTSISATGTSVSAQGALYRLTGADTVTPIGASIGVFQGQTDPTGTSLQITGTAAGSLIIMGASDWSAGVAAHTITISGVASSVTDLDTATTDFRAISAHGAQSASTNQGTLDYTAATGDWAAVLFEVKAAGAAAAGEAFIPTRSRRATPRSRFRLYQPTRRSLVEVEAAGVPAVSAFADVATATADVTLDAAVRVEATADQATATGTALDAAAAAGVLADVATATGSAFDATVSTLPAVSATGDIATATGTAFDASVAVAATGDIATATRTALDAAAALGVTGDIATATGTAFDATTSTASLTNATGDVANGTGTAFDASVAIALTGDVASAAGTALDAAAALAVNADQATATGTAFGPTPALTVNADQATGTGTAFDATVSASGNTSATADVATATAAALDAAAALAVTGDIAAAAGTAFDATVVVGALASAGVATGTGTAFDASVGVGVMAPAGVATATGTAFDATTAVPYVRPGNLTIADRRTGSLTVQQTGRPGIASSAAAVGGLAAAARPAGGLAGADRPTPTITTGG
jgi:hypothetical protein